MPVHTKAEKKRAKRIVKRTKTKKGSLTYARIQTQIVVQSLKTISKSQQMLYAFHTDKMKGVPKGKVRVHLVSFEVLEIDTDDAKSINFSILPQNHPEATMMCAVMK